MHNFQEKTFMCKIIGADGYILDFYLYIHFGADEVTVSLSSKSLYYENRDYDFPESLIGVLRNFQVGTKLQLEHKVFVINNTNQEMEKVDMIETVSLYTPNEDEEYFLKFHLAVEINGKIYEAEDCEDFSSALEKLSKKSNVKFQICAFCKNSSFMSRGGEDLRFGWFCFRELQVDLRLPWFEREEEFEKAIPNVDALHWCPKFITKT